MTERTDEEKGTEPDTTQDWARDLEGASDVLTEPDGAETPRDPNLETDEHPKQ